MHGGQLRKYRLLVTDAFDDAMFSLALLDRYPGVRFASGVNAYPTPALVEGPTIPECDSSVARVYFPPADWQAEFEAVGADGDAFVLSNPPAPMLLFARSRWFWGVHPAMRHGKWAFSLPTLEHGHITCAYEADSPSQRALVRAVWRLLERITTNRLAGVQPRTESPRLMKDRGGMLWAGHHALEWCAAAPRRMLDGCRRPADDWRFPDDAWLLDLRRRVAERWGPDYGAPPQEAPDRLP
jgi:hypothetical protein